MLGPLLGGLLIGTGLLGRGLYEDYRKRRAGMQVEELLGSAPAGGGEGPWGVTPENGSLIAGAGTDIQRRVDADGNVIYDVGGGGVNVDQAQGAGEGGAGSGLLADPSDPRRQLKFAAGLMGIPVYGERGAGLMQQLISQQSVQAGARGLQREELAMRAQDSERAYGQWMTVENRLEREFQLNAQKYGTEFAYRKLVDDRSALQEQARIDIARAAQRYQAAGRDVTLGSAPQGGAIVMTQKGPMVTYLPGSKEFKEATSAIDDMALMQNNVARLNAMVDKWGTTATGEVAGQAKLLHSQMLGYLGRLGNAGVLNEGEVARYSEALPDPSQWSSKRYGKDRISAAYTELYRLIGEKIQAAKAQVGPWGVIGTVGRSRQADYYEQGGGSSALPPGTQLLPDSGAMPAPARGRVNSPALKPMVPLGEANNPVLQGEQLLKRVPDPELRYFGPRPSWDTDGQY
jgi:hypothetical protein